MGLTPALKHNDRTSHVHWHADQPSSAISGAGGSRSYVGFPGAVSTGFPVRADRFGSGASPVSENAKGNLRKSLARDSRSLLRLLLQWSELGRRSDALSPASRRNQKRSSVLHIDEPDDRGTTRRAHAI